MNNEVYYLSEQPRGWHAATAKKVRNQYAYVPGESRQDAYTRIKREQEIRWEKQTGEKPEDSRFTLIMPIHNEVNAFPSAFSTLLSSDIPLSVKVDIFLITNACTDQTPRMVDVALSRLGKPEEISLEGEFADPKLERNVISVAVGNRTYTHIDTASAGKANALTIGNTLALQKGYKSAICIDANNYPEPGAIGKLYGSFRKAKKGNESVVASSGKTNLIIKSDFYKPFKGKFAGSSTTSKHPELMGALMAWDTNWVKSIGGVPPVAVEDYALSVVARSQEKTIRRDLDACTWGYSAGNMGDVMRTRERYIRGRLQIQDLYPHTKMMIHEELFVTRDLIGRMQEYIGWAKETPARIPLYIASSMMWEGLRLKAKMGYKKDPTNQTWEPIKSTK